VSPAKERRQGVPVDTADPVSFRINGERLVVLGWARAILLQLAHPLIAAGVWEHSGFRASPIAAVQRLHHTTRAMLAITFGDEARREAALDGIRRIHRRVNGTLRETVGPFAAGTPYSAEDPALLLWVHATLIESMLVTYEALVGPLSPADLDAYCEQSAPASIALGVREEEMPRTWDALQACLRRTYASGAIVVSPQAHELADALLRASLPRPLAAANGITSLLTRGLLPSSVRNDYRMSWTPADERRYRRIVRMLRGLRSIAPVSVARFRDARRDRST
jgi:uncharacterized protein (DUF2236 family)